MSKGYQDSSASPFLIGGEKSKFWRGSISSAAIAGLALLATTLPALSQALPAPTNRAGTVVGKLTVTFKVAPPAGSRVFCSLGLVSNDTRAPSDAKSTDVAVAAGKAVCNITVRYNWHLSSANSNMTIVYSASGPSQSSSGIYNIIPMPANNRTTNVAVAITQ